MNCLFTAFTAFTTLTIHHSNYIRFLEEARSRWMEELNIPMEKLENEGFTIPTLEVDCK